MGRGRRHAADFVRVTGSRRTPWADRGGPRTGFLRAFTESSISGVSQRFRLLRNSTHGAGLPRWQTRSSPAPGISDFPCSQFARIGLSSSCRQSMTATKCAQAVGPAVDGGAIHRPALIAQRRPAAAAAAPVAAASCVADAQTSLSARARGTRPSDSPATSHGSGAAPTTSGRGRVECCAIKR